MQDNKRVIGRKTIAKELGVTPQTISNWTTRGLLNGCIVKVGKKAEYDLQAIRDKFKI